MNLGIGSIALETLKEGGSPEGTISGGTDHHTWGIKEIVTKPKTTNRREMYYTKCLKFLHNKNIVINKMPNTQQN